MSTTTTYLTHRHTNVLCEFGPTDRVIAPGEAPTCGRCRIAFAASNCPGFNLYSVATEVGTLVVANDNEHNAQWSARIMVARALDVSERDVEVPLSAVMLMGPNPAAAEWDAIRAGAR